MLYELICEGRCNPLLAEADRMVEAHAASRSKVGGGWFEDPRLFALQHRLRHTPHEIRGAYTAACVDCGTERQYGGMPFYGKRRAS